jgi:hypothetical protein
MDKHSFLEYLSDYNKLSELDSQTLQRLTERFAYCQNLHFLGCKKAQISADENYPALLAKAATYSTDRAFLFKKLHDEDEIPDIMVETVLDVPNDAEAHALEDIAEAIVHQRESQEDVLISKTLSDLNVVKGSIAEAVRVDEMEQNEQQITFSGLQFHNIDYLSDQDNLQETGQVQQTGPLPKSEFNSYRRSNPGIAFEGFLTIDESEMEAARISLEAKRESDEAKRRKKDVGRKQTKELIKFAEKSLIEKQDTVTETLARLLALQGHKDKAIAVYEKLKLQIPEKSTYFAAQIEKLKIS